VLRTPKAVAVFESAVAVLLTFETSAVAVSEYPVLLNVVRGVICTGVRVARGVRCTCAAETPKLAKLPIRRSTINEHAASA